MRGRHDHGRPLPIVEILPCGILMTDAARNTRSRRLESLCGHDDGVVKNGTPNGKAQQVAGTRNLCFPVEGVELEGNELFNNGNSRLYRRRGGRNPGTCLECGEKSGSSGVRMG